CFPGYIPWPAAHFGNANGEFLFFQQDPWMQGYMSEGNMIKINGLRFMGWSEQPVGALQLDGPTLASFTSRAPFANGEQRASNNPPTIQYDSNATLGAAMAFHPSLGGNWTYIGGHWHRGAFIGYATGAMTPPTGAPGSNPRWIVSKVSDVFRPD